MNLIQFPDHFKIDLSIFMDLSTSEDNIPHIKKHLKKPIKILLKNSTSPFKKEIHIVIKKSLSLIQFSDFAVKPNQK